MELIGFIALCIGASAIILGAIDLCRSKSTRRPFPEVRMCYGCKRRMEDRGVPCPACGGIIFISSLVGCGPDKQRKAAG